MDKRLRSLKAGDRIRCTDPDGTVITVTILNITVDPTWGNSGSTMLEIFHEPSNKKSWLTLSNLVSWFNEQTWKIVE